MKGSTSLPAVRAFLVYFLCATAQADEPPKHQLSSVQELDRLYRRSTLAQSRNGLECFSGGRKDLDPKYQANDQLHIFDKNTLQVWSLSSKQTEEQIGRDGVAYAALDSSGTKLAATAWFRDEATRAPYRKIVLIDLKTLDCEVAVADGWLNCNPSFSPDGRYIAYYATDRRTNPLLDPSHPLRENAGRVVNIRTKEVTTVTEPIVMSSGFYCSEEGCYGFRPPRWLDGDRVLFHSITTDPTFVRQYIGNFTGNICSYVAVANVATGEVKRLFLLGYIPWMPAYVQSVVDPAARRLFLSDGKRVVQTDFRLGSPTVIGEAAEGEVIMTLQLENGQVRYSKQPLSDYHKRVLSGK